MKTTTLLLLPLLLLAACDGGGDRDGSFVSRAKPSPEGEPIEITYRLRPGERIVGSMEVDQTMNTKVEGRNRPNTFTMRMDEMSYLCEEVLPDGALKMRLTMGEMTLTSNGEKVDLEELLGGLREIEGSMEILPDGTVRNYELSGGLFEDPRFAKIKNLTQYAQLIRYPPEGIRVGEAIDIRNYIPEDLFGNMGQAMPPGVDADMDLQGELVLLRTEEIDGERAAIFGLTAVIHMTMDMVQGGEGTSMTMDVRLSGEMPCSTETGMPIGTMTLTSTGEGSSGGRGQSMSFTMTQKMTMNWVRVKPE
jgi:hypothetical protein